MIPMKAVEEQSHDGKAESSSMWKRWHVASSKSQGRRSRSKANSLIGIIQKQKNKQYLYE